jgi:DNA-binding NarL/FixJ family response regulator
LQDIDENLNKTINNNQTNNKRAGISNTKYQNQVAWRRNKVKELLARGYTQYEISRELHMSQPTISRDIHYLEKHLLKKLEAYQEAS